MNIEDRLRHCAKHTGLDAVVELLNEAATHIEGLNSTPKLQGDPSWWMRETDEGAEWTDTAPLVLSGWTPLYTTPQPAQATQAASAEDMKVYDSIADRYFIEAVPKDHQIAALVNKVRDIARMFHDHQSLRERIAIELVPALKASQEVKSNAERWRYAIANGGNQSMNFIDIFDDWDGDGSFVEAFDKARLADKKEGSAA